MKGPPSSWSPQPIQWTNWWPHSMQCSSSSASSMSGASRSVSEKKSSPGRRLPPQRGQSSLKPLSSSALFHCLRKSECTFHSLPFFADVHHFEFGFYLLGPQFAEQQLLAERLRLEDGAGYVRSHLFALLWRDARKERDHLGVYLIKRLHTPFEALGPGCLDTASGVRVEYLWGHSGGLLRPVGLRSFHLLAPTCLLSARFPTPRAVEAERACAAL